MPATSGCSRAYTRRNPSTRVTSGQYPAHPLSVPRPIKWNVPKSILFGTLELVEVHDEMSTAAYRDLENLPERAIGELFDGRLHALPRPSAPHGYTHSAVGGKLFNPFHNGIGGPGG